MSSFDLISGLYSMNQLNKPHKSQSQSKTNCTNLKSRSKTKKRSTNINANVQIDEYTLLISNKINEILSDPLSIIIIFLIIFLSYLYFAGELLCQIIGLFFPSYYLYDLLSISYDPNEKLNKIMNVVKYFIIYSHFQCLTLIFSIFGFYFYHLKIVILLSLVYLMAYQPILLNTMYNRIINYDYITYLLLKTNIIKFMNTSLKSNKNLGKL